MSDIGTFGGQSISVFNTFAVFGGPFTVIGLSATPTAVQFMECSGTALSEAALRVLNFTHRGYRRLARLISATASVLMAWHYTQYTIIVYLIHRWYTVLKYAIANSPRRACS